ncbi:elongation factor Ts, mitochondrial isoform X1 [Hylaeus volcanicus]|uniref:elongation factor Ts, mitochondrial isoform X1 n=2 Tax=Hylaeus volcanicus TaxID=313075 RepID=UPI0023B7FE89|nr:elongation factor Ts, mitochondrial isoform X1 [Hylaeus volcanicus]
MMFGYFEMIPRQLFRSLHANYSLCYSSKKTLLGKLRKKTGYTFVNCKKALEMHDNDIEKAELWLTEQAQAQGWTQATKLQSRVTTQGLIAMITNENHGALVEVNCETDFVARNKKFHDLTETIVSSVLKHGMTMESKALVAKNMLYTEFLNSLPAGDGKTLADHSALTIGSIGENINIKRALCMSVQPGVQLYGCTHPNPVNPVPSSFGRYGALVAIRSKVKNPMIGLQLCQHVIGMNPIKIGDPKVDEPHDDIEDEQVMLYQEFLLDHTISIQQLLESEQIEIVDFARFEIGEPIERDETLDAIETCG